MEEKTEIGIKRIRIIVDNQWKWMKEKLEESSTAIWKEWSGQAAKLQVFNADAENRTKTEYHFYKMDEESIITIQEELSEDFQVMAQVQMDEIRKILEEFEDDQIWKTRVQKECETIQLG